MIVPDNHLALNVRLFDLLHEVKSEIGKYENVNLIELNIEAYIRDIRKSFNTTIKQLEIDLNNFKKGNS